MYDYPPSKHICSENTPQNVDPVQGEFKMFPHVDRVFLDM